MELTLSTILALDRSKKILILAVTLGLLAAIYVWTLFLPATGRIRAADKELSQLLDKKAEKEAIAANLAAFKREYQHLEEAVHLAMAQLPDKKEIPSLLQAISNLGRESGLEMPMFRPGKPTPKDFYAEVPVDIKLMGSFQDMLGFFHRVGNLPRIVSVSDLSVQGAKAGEQPGALNASCVATTYKFLEESERQAQEEKAGKGRQAKRRKRAKN